MQVRVTFTRVEVKKDGDWIGAGDWYFPAEIDGARVGRSRDIFSARENDDINLPAADWHGIVDVRGKDEFDIEFQVMDQDPISDDDMGTVTHTIRRPYRQGNFSGRTRNFVVHWTVELEVAGGYGPHPAGTVFATRRNPGAGDVTYETVAGVRQRARMEIHPVRPNPPDANLPPRPPVPAGVTVVRNGGAVAVTDASDLNIVPNPSVLPILTSPALAGPPPPNRPTATAQNTPTIESSYYWPDTLNFTDNDARLEWEIDPAANAAFLGGNHGRKVQIYGRAEGDVLLRMRFLGELFAEYRPTVKEIKNIPFRANILNGPNAASQPTARPEDVARHIDVANRFLYQVGLQLVPDTDVARTNSATATAHAGIFRIRVSANRTRNVHGNYPTTSRLNCRDHVLNIQYVHSLQAPAGWVIFGRATDFPDNGNGASIDDSDTPTPSWYRPAGNGCGVDPDVAPGGNVTMNLLATHQRASHPNLFAFLITNGNGDATDAARDAMYGNVITHELGHVLNLRHRAGAGPDGLGHPPRENIMCQGEPPGVRQDLDRLQAEAVRGSPLVP